MFMLVALERELTNYQAVVRTVERRGGSGLIVSGIRQIESQRWLPRQILVLEEWRVSLVATN